ncbi:hypothetical protein [Streptomyces scopuliridis]|uniref:hypothetical protein n=1 Tax=Streptomyces scopuliridis TaxID=452529 RepID=UPI0036BCF5E6
MSIHQVSCPGRILFLDEEMAALDRLEGGFRSERVLWCALEAGHEGLHHVIAQCVRGSETAAPWVMWARWPETGEYGPERELLRLESCPEKFLAGNVSEESCCLPEGHAGRHGFEFGPPIREADVMPDWLLRRFFG